MKEYRYQLEKYRGRSTRHVCPQCGRKQVFTRYIDTYNNNIYINDNVGKCNRLDKCGYHYTPKQYYTDNPWKRDCDFVTDIGKITKTQSQTPRHEPPKCVCVCVRRVSQSEWHIYQQQKSVPRWPKPLGHSFIGIATIVAT